MKKLTIAVLLVASVTDAQTITAARLSHNAILCVSASLPKTCTDAQFQAVVGHQPGTVYATDAAFRDGEVLPKVLNERRDRDLQRAAELFTKAFYAATGNQRVAACTDLGLPDPEVCR